MRVFSRCGECGLEVDYRVPKDEESMTGEEMFDHYEAEHPDKVERVGDVAVGIPYTDVEVVE